MFSLTKEEEGSSCYEFANSWKIETSKTECELWGGKPVASFVKMNGALAILKHEAKVIWRISQKPESFKMPLKNSLKKCVIKMECFDERWNSSFLLTRYAKKYCTNVFQMFSLLKNIEVFLKKCVSGRINCQ